MPNLKNPTKFMQLHYLLILLLISASRTMASTCPMDLTYISTFPWDPSSCLPATNLTMCCQTLLSLLGIALSTRLSSTSQFNLPSIPIANACLANFQSNLTFKYPAMSSEIVLTCFPSPDQFLTSKNFCAGVENVSDFTLAAGNASLDSLDDDCHGDLLDNTQCLSCYNTGVGVAKELTVIDGNFSHATNCFYYTILYAGGVVNSFGPDDPRAAWCIFGLPIVSSKESLDRGNSQVRHKVVVYASVFGALGFVIVIVVIGLIWWRTVKKRQERKRLGLVFGHNLGSYRKPNTGAIWFDIKELEKATGNFSQVNFIGRGGFGIVYKGCLQDESLVAVKKVLELELEGGDEEFRNEVEIISQLRHRNLVPLRGCSIKEDVDVEDGRQRFLVYEYMPNGSLDDHLFAEKRGKRPPLSWPQRKNIILDVAKGLQYLHYGVKPAIYHRDIKATNILLDGEMRARVADFGLAKQSREGQSHLTTRVAGTHGYLAPEYALYGQLTDKSDVYSFGVLVLEIMSGRRALDTSSTVNLLLVTDWAWAQVKAGRVEDVLDEALLNDGEGSMNPRGIMERFVLVGILCAHVMVALRPTIAEAMKMLEGDIEVPSIPDRPMPLAHGMIYGDSGNFSVSPSLSCPSMNSGDMLR